MSKTMFDDDLHMTDTGDSGGSVIPAASERPDRDPVVVRRQAALSALIGLGASMLSGLYLWRAVDQGGAANWAIGAVLAGLALFHITQWIDGRTPLLVADNTGIRLRLGNVWHGLLWQDVSRITVQERQGLLRDGRVVVHPADETALDDLSPRSRRRLAANSRMYGAPFAIPLGVTTVASTGDLAGSLAEFADDTTVVELVEPAAQPDRDFDTEPDTEPDIDARTEALTRPGAEPEPETEPYDEPDTEVYEARDTAYGAGYDADRDTGLDSGPDTEVYDARPDTDAYDQETGISTTAGYEADTTADTPADIQAALEADDEYNADWFFDEETAIEVGPEPEPGAEPQPGAEPEPSREPEPASEPEPGPGPRPEPQWRRRRWRGQQREERPQEQPDEQPEEQPRELAEEPVSEAPQPPEQREPGDPLEPVQPARPLRRAVRADVTRRPTVRAPVVGQLALQEPLPTQPSARTGADQGEGAGGDDRRAEGPDRPRGPRPRGNMSLVLGDTPPPLPPEPEPEPEPMPVVPEETAPDPAANPVIGPVIAEARRLLRLSVDELATRTRIRPHVIEAIEVDDFGPCAGDFYARGHLRALSRVLGVDPAPLVQQFDERYASAPINARRVFEAELAAGASSAFRGVGHQSGPRWGALVIAVLVLVLVWILVTILGAGSSGTSNDADLDSGAAHVPRVHRTYDGAQAADTA